MHSTVPILIVKIRAKNGNFFMTSVTFFGQTQSSLCRVVEKGNLLLRAAKEAVNALWYAHTGAKTNFLSRNYQEFEKNVNFVKNEILKM